MGRRVLCVCVALAIAGGAAAVGQPAQAPRVQDFAAVALNVLPPGEAGGAAITRHSTDQIALYDSLTPRRAAVRPADLRRFFKSARFGVAGAGPARVERTPRRGLRIVRDRYGVAHVYGRTRADVMYGAGWVTMADRGLLLTLLRYPGRLAAIDAPGIDPFSLVGASRRFVPSAQTEAFLDAQLALLARSGAAGRRVLRDMDAYVAGLNAHNRSHPNPVPTWTRRDIVSIVALLVARFGAGGGDEVRASQFLSALQRTLGAARGRAVWEDLRERDDPDAPVAVDGRFPYDLSTADESGSVVIDDGSFRAVRPGAEIPARAAMSNALLVSARRSASRRPIMVAGPQVGYFYPQLLLELDLHGGGIDARGASVPGLSFVLLIGRGKDFAWSLTSSGSDVVDHFVETLCGDDAHYLYRGACTPMEVFDAGAIVGREGEPERVVFRTTVHGPVIGYATAGARRVAVSSLRSTRGRELLSAIPFQELMANRPRSARGFVRVMSRLEAALNTFYVDDRSIAQYTGGRLPLRAPGTVSGLPTLGTGEYEWRGYLSAAGHPRGINPRAGVLVNWNNKPARGFAAADDHWSYGSVHRVDLLARALARRTRHTPATVVGAMNEAATQDLRGVELVPTIAAVLQTGPAPSPRAQELLQILLDWNRTGAHRLDSDLDGKIEHVGAAVMDAAWPRIADAVLSPVLGPLVDRLADLEPRDDPPAAGGSAYIAGWYGYVDKDLRTLLGQPVAAPLRTRYCGAGDLGSCRVALWDALEAAGAELALAHGPDPRGWQADATAERIRFAGFLPRSMHWANRPTYQQVMSFR